MVVYYYTDANGDLHKVTPDGADVVVEEYPVKKEETFSDEPDG